MPSTSGSSTWKSALRLEASHGPNWWDKCVEQPIKDEVERNKKREADAGISLRSENEIDYTTFGQLGDIIKKNWNDFAGMLSQSICALPSYLPAEHASRCDSALWLLADDEVDRLKLTIKDWFRVLAGPTA